MKELGPPLHDVSQTLTALQNESKKIAIHTQDTLNEIRALKDPVTHMSKRWGDVETTLATALGETGAMFCQSKQRTRETCWPVRDKMSTRVAEVKCLVRF